MSDCDKFLKFLLATNGGFSSCAKVKHEVKCKLPFALSLVNGLPDHIKYSCYDETTFKMSFDALGKTNSILVGMEYSNDDKE